MSATLRIRSTSTRNSGTIHAVQTIERTRAKMAKVWPLLGKPFSYHRRMVQVTGGAKAALMLSCAIHGVRFDQASLTPDGWLVRSADQWAAGTGLSVKEQATARLALRELGLFIERRVGQPARLHIGLDLQQLMRHVAAVTGVHVEVADWADTPALLRLLGPAVSFHGRLARVGGSAHAGLLLSRVLHLMRGQLHRGRVEWVSANSQRWCEELGLTASQDRHARDWLAHCGLWQQSRGTKTQAPSVRIDLEILVERLGPERPGEGPLQATQPVSRIAKKANQDCGQTTSLIGQNHSASFAEITSPYICIDTDLYLKKLLLQQRAQRACEQPPKWQDCDSASTSHPSADPAKRWPAAAGQTAGNAITLAQAQGVDEARWVFPPGMSAKERHAATLLLADLTPEEGQTLLDELGGRMQRATLRGRPIAYLHGLVQRLRAGCFVPDLAIEVARLREPRGASPGLQGLGSETVEPGLSIGWDGATHGPAQVADAQMPAAIDRAPGDASAPGGVTHAAPEAVATAAGTAADVAGAEMSALQLRRAESLRQLRDVSQRLSARHGPLPPRAPRKFSKEQR